MHISLSSMLQGGAFALAATLTIPVLAQTAAPAPAHAAPDPARLNALAHRLLEAAVKSNALGGPEMKPWHIKVDFQIMPDNPALKPDSGTFEEWYAGPNRWKRSYTGTVPEWVGSEWSVSKIERYATRLKHGEFADYFLTLRVSRPVVDPLYQVANIQPDMQLKVARLETPGLTANCTSLADPPANMGTKPEWFIPTMCFDSELHLRLIKSENTAVQFEDIQPFEGRAVARHVTVLDGGRVTAEMKVMLLEKIDTLDEAMLKPAADAEPQPYVIEPGYPQPVAVYEVGTTIPLMDNGQPYRGNLMVPVIIHKDGTVKVLHQASGSFLQPIFDAVNLAVAKWRYKPYVVDGQPVEAAYNAKYIIDGKKFVPSYERTKP